MGFKHYQDGKCNFCGRHDVHRCDDCGLMICKEHQVKRTFAVGMWEGMVCPNCAKKKRK
ncbi:hypothetical protein HZB02_05635 [Candidatus Woesearchaeota archaeon]|nr:hypothetical protein [Candidatus Woesearchaeota archaeon]